MLDQALTPQAQLNYKAHYFISAHRKKQYSIVFLQSSYLQTHICSFAVLIVSYTNLNQTTRKGHSYSSSTRVNNGDPMNPYLAAQLQAVAKYAQQAVRHTYLQSLRSTCNGLNQVIRITQAAMTEHPTLAARALLNASYIHVKSSGHLLQTWPCAPVQKPRVTAMPQGTCSKRAPIKYTFFNRQHTGFLDTHTNIIYSDPLHTDCATADYIPIIWNGTYALYRQNGSVMPLSKVRTLQWAPFSDANLRLTVTAPTFQQLEIYNLSDFNDIATEDFVSAAISQT